jgi:hypothetical protein
VLWGLVERKWAADKGNGLGTVGKRIVIVVDGAGKEVKL